MGVGEGGRDSLVRKGEKGRGQGSPRVLGGSGLGESAIEKLAAFAWPDCIGIHLEDDTW